MEANGILKRVALISLRLLFEEGFRLLAHGLILFVGRFQRNRQYLLKPLLCWLASLLQFPSGRFNLANRTEKGLVVYVAKPDRTNRLIRKALSPKKRAQE